MEFVEKAFDLIAVSSQMEGLLQGKAAMTGNRREYQELVEVNADLVTAFVKQFDQILKSSIEITKKLSLEGSSYDWQTAYVVLCNSTMLK